MSYDYSSSSTKLEMPNPYRVQNQLLFTAAAVLCLSGLWSLWSSRQTLAPVPIVVGLALLFAGIVAAGTAAKRLRFFFGRGRPVSLAPDLAPTVVGTSPQAGLLQKLLREGALIYPEPSGAIDGVLYHWVPRLITAPLAIQQQARVAFFNLAALLVTTLSFGFAWGVFGTEVTRPWLSAGYFLFGALFLLRPLISSSTARLTTASLVLLIALAIVGPAVLGTIAHRLPAATHWSLAPQTLMMLVSGLVAVTLMLLATLDQVQQPPETQTSSEQLRLSLNVPPSLLLDELERHLQEQWVERIPNRRYARATPSIDPALQAGSFAGELFEETQPMPLAGSAPPSFAQALGSKRHRWLAVLDLYATGLMLLAVLCALVFARQAGLSGDSPELSLRLLGASTIFMLVAAFCLRSSSKLWGRFDFESVLVWVEMGGTYQTATMGTGNALTARVQTSNQIVRTESMTLRVWRARIESVVFGKDGLRQVTAMFSSDAETKALARHLAEFGRSRASLVAPESQADLGRMQALAAAERALHPASATPAAQLQNQSSAAALLAGGSIPPAVSAEAGTSQVDASPSRYCPACGHKAHADARFCVECGARLGG